MLNKNQFCVQSQSEYKHFINLSPLPSHQVNGRELVITCHDFILRNSGGMFKSSLSQPISENNPYILLILLLYHPPQDLLPLLTPLIYSCLSSASFLNGSTTSNLLLFNCIFYLAARVTFLKTQTQSYHFYTQTSQSSSSLGADSQAPQSTPTKPLNNLIQTHLSLISWQTLTLLCPTIFPPLYSLSTFCSTSLHMLCSFTHEALHILFNLEIFPSFPFSLGKQAVN